MAPASKAVLKYPKKRHFNTHRRNKKNDAGKLNKLPGVVFYRILSNGERCLAHGTSKLRYTARGPPFGNLNNFNFQIFGGTAMNRNIVHKNFSENFFNLETPPQGYPLGWFTWSSRRGVSA